MPTTGQQYVRECTAASRLLPPRSGLGVAGAIRADDSGGIVCGDGRSGMCRINPSPGTFINGGDQIVMLRPTSYAKNAYRPAAAAVQLPPSVSRPFPMLPGLPRPAPRSPFVLPARTCETADDMGLRFFLAELAIELHGCVPRGHRAGSFDAYTTRVHNYIRLVAPFNRSSWPQPLPRASTA